MGLARDGLDGALSRVLVEMNSPISLVAIALALIALDALSARWWASFRRSNRDGSPIRFALHQSGLSSRVRIHAEGPRPLFPHRRIRLASRRTLGWTVFDVGRRHDNE